MLRCKYSPLSQIRRNDNDINLFANVSIYALYWQFVFDICNVVSHAFSRLLLAMMRLEVSSATSFSSFGRFYLLGRLSIWSGHVWAQKRLENALLTPRPPPLIRSRVICAAGQQQKNSEHASQRNFLRRSAHC